MRDLHVIVPSPPLLHCDNLSTLALSTNLVFHSRIKHLDIDYHFVREKVQKGDLLVQYIPTKEQLEDLFTKGYKILILLDIAAILTVGTHVKIEGSNNRWVATSHLYAGCLTCKLNGSSVVKLRLASYK